MRNMKAAVFVAPGRIVLDEKPVPTVGPGDALIRITTTTICGTDEKWSRKSEQRYKWKLRA